MRTSKRKKARAVVAGAARRGALICMTLDVSPALAALAMGGLLGSFLSRENILQEAHKQTAPQ